VKVKDEMRAIGNEKSARAIQSCSVAKGGISWVLESKKQTSTFLAQGVNLVKERRDMDDDARANDARDGWIDKSCCSAIKEMSCLFLAAD
jgi:hypothetical protein